MTDKNGGFQKEAASLGLYLLSAILLVPMLQWSVEYGMNHEIGRHGPANPIAYPDWYWLSIMIAVIPLLLIVWIHRNKIGL